MEGEEIQDSIGSFWKPVYSVTMIQLGIAGCGVIATTRHLSALRKIKQIRVVAFADTDAGRLCATGDRFHVAKRYNACEALIQDPAVPAVAVCLPPALHSATATLVLQSGKQPFLEKPTALDLMESTWLVNLAARSDKVAALVLESCSETEVHHELT